MIGIMLESESYTPTLCHDGAKALDAFHEVNPDLVLLDLMLPGLDGVEICRLIRSESDVPIISARDASSSTTRMRVLIARILA